MTCTSITYERPGFGMCLAQQRAMAQNFQFELEDTAQAQLPDASRFLPSVELRQFFPSQVDAIKPFIGQLMGFISKFRNGDGSETDIDLALHEALANAVIHGNGENPDKRVYVACRCDANGEVLITFRDQGQGFDSRNIPDPTDFENRLCTHGRGIYLMRASMDQVYFDEGGAVVRMRKRPNAGCAAAADQHS
jgi:serine/threonine-protein kinase RsbW